MISDTATDGQKVTLRTHRRSDTRPPVLYVNGISTDMAQATQDGQTVADKLGRDVTVIHDATTGSMIGDGLDLIKDRAGVGDNPADDALRETIEDRLEHDQDPIDIVGFSRGAQVVARALREVREDLIQAGLKQGLTQEQAVQHADQELSRVDVMNLAGAAQKNDFPQAVQYHHTSIEGDPVAENLGDRAGDYDPASFPQRVLQTSGQIAGNLDKHNLYRLLNDPTTQSEWCNFLA